MQAKKRKARVDRRETGGSFKYRDLILLVFSAPRSFVERDTKKPNDWIQAVLPFHARYFAYSGNLGRHLFDFVSPHLLNVL